MANLSASELLKPGREYRASVIIKKMTEGSDFVVSSGKKIKFHYSKDIIDLLNQNNPTAYNSIKFLGEDGNSYKLSDLQKTAEFGGKGEGASTAKEDAQLASLRDQIANAKFKEVSSIIQVRVGTKVYNITDAASTAGTPKSDFHLLDVNGNEVVWISHKDGRGPKDFQQWGGISQRSEPKIFSHPETQKFIADLKKAYPNGLPSATSLYRKINDENLKMMSVYGNNFGRALGQQNVSILLQGPVRLEKSSGKNYILNAYNVHFNGDEMNGGFEPVFMAIYKGDRSDAGVKGTRIVIMPIAGRKATEFP